MVERSISNVNVSLNGGKFFCIRFCMIEFSVAFVRCSIVCQYFWSSTDSIADVSFDSSQFSSVFGPISFEPFRVDLISNSSSAFTRPLCGVRMQELLTSPYWIELEHLLTNIGQSFKSLVFTASLHSDLMRWIGMFGRLSLVTFVLMRSIFLNEILCFNRPNLSSACSLNKWKAKPNEWENWIDHKTHSTHNK